MTPRIAGFAATAVALALSAPAQAQLQVEILGLPNTTSSLVRFSGSATLAGTGTLRTDPLLMDELKGSGVAADYVSSTGPFYNNYIANYLSGNAQVRVNSGVWYSIGALHIDHDNSGDDFGFSIVNAGGDISLLSGDVLEFSGSSLFALDLGKLNIGTYTFSNWNDSATTSANLSVATVPEPGEWAAMGILATGLAGMVVRNRRRQA